MNYYVITFVNTHGAISAEKHLKKEYKIIVMPTPREISRGCGIAIRFGEEAREGVLKNLASFALEKALYSIYQFKDGAYTLIR